MADTSRTESQCDSRTGNRTANNAEDAERSLSGQVEVEETRGDGIDADQRADLSAAAITVSEPCGGIE